MILLINTITQFIEQLIKLKPIDAKDNTYVDTKKGVNDKGPKFEVGDRV